LIEYEKNSSYCGDIAFDAGIAFAKQFKVKKDEGQYDVEAKIDAIPAHSRQQ
jgi:hypothetical protein